MVTGLADLLQHIGGWRVGCINHTEVEALVAKAERDGYVGRRLHYAPQHPTEGDPAFEVTDEGLRKLRELAGADQAEDANRARQWYRDNTFTPKS